MLVDTPTRKQSHKDKANESLENPQNSKCIVLQDISANINSSQMVQLFEGTSSHLYISQTFVKPVKISETCQNKINLAPYSFGVFP